MRDTNALSSQFEIFRDSSIASARSNTYEFYEAFFVVSFLFFFYDKSVTRQSLSVTVTPLGLRASRSPKNRDS